MFSEIVKMDKTPEEAIRCLEQKLAERKLQLLWKYEVPTKLFEQGIRFDQNYWILEVSHPELTKKMLLQNRYSGFFLPCKIIVYRDQTSNKTHLGLLRPTSVFPLLEDQGLQNMAQQLEERLISVLNEIEEQSVA
ncbi:DUF302 domain-containing protein [Paenactinomyces guangxiensis]|uniref:DUF302 domain-containing protein n=1 Tax=Paenactinomyces guangxiensis TaxID=1490290 RepID=A0A7W2A942_9BACL|nr:DUF302 domain-containing protein [Paenactinomyces guangxiensis]MBA4495320.1 DUF302 domain-containing protein [Paenactinomyces guangxiensis]MBH8592558.1 DUF302 domain-containing protein [Paenactinomyces guangxiensis]